MTRYLRDGIEIANEWSCRIFQYALIAIVSCMFFEVIARYAFNAPTLWGPETAELLFGLVAFMAGGYALVHGLHVKVDIFSRRWSPRVRAIVDSCTGLLFFIFAGGYLWGGIPHAWHAWVIRETSGSVWNPPLWPYKWVLVVGFVLILLQGLVYFAHNVVYAIRGKGELPA